MTDKRYSWILTKTSFDDGVKDVHTIGVFGWVGFATGHVKHLTGDPNMVWTSSNSGVRADWVSEAGEDGSFYTITSVRLNPRA